MAAPELIQVLRSTLCPDLTVQEAEHVALATVPRRVPAQGRICQEGDPSGGLVFLVRGAAEVVKDSPGGSPQVVATVHGPIMLGEIGLLTGQPVSATVRARSDCECYLLTRSQFQRLLDEHYSGVYKLVLAIARLLARRLTAMNARVVALCQD
jgi:CRP-like cAMP-binding protein